MGDTVLHRVDLKLRSAQVEALEAFRCNASLYKGIVFVSLPLSCFSVTPTSVFALPIRIAKVFLAATNTCTCYFGNIL